jgi:hypothetical protein
MSANNFLWITKDNRVVMRDADTGDEYKSTERKFDTLEEAVDYAQEVCDRDTVEYGISFEPRNVPAQPNLNGDKDHG